MTATDDLQVYERPTGVGQTQRIAISETAVYQWRAASWRQVGLLHGKLVGNRKAQERRYASLGFVRVAEAARG